MLLRDGLSSDFITFSCLYCVSNKFTGQIYGLACHVAPIKREKAVLDMMLFHSKYQYMVEIYLPFRL